MIRLLARPAAALLLLTFALPALAAPGARLSWDHCALGGRVSNKAFACGTNAGSEMLVLSYEPPVAKNDCVGIEVVMHILSSSGAMPDWWQLVTAGCRASSMAFSLVPEDAGTCEFPYGEITGGGIAGFTADHVGPGSWRLLALAAVPAAQPWAVLPGKEYLAFALKLNHLKTTGTGACSGCNTPVCIGIGSVRVVDINNQSNFELLANGPNPGGGEESVTWQGAYTHEYYAYRELGVVLATMTCDPDASSPVRASTWGAVKSLYR